ncbi:MAG: hypothetical protein ACI9HK_002195 [Pirellulaceae bacterium]|jgi:hypothetical protein
MFKRITFTTIFTLSALFMTSLCMSGCGGEQPNAGNRGTPSENGGSNPSGDGDSATGVFTVASSDIPKFSHYLGTALDGGRVRVAAPDQWNISPRGSQYLAMFKKSKSLSFPRILVRGKDSSASEFGVVTKDNVDSFATRMQKELEGAKLKSPVRPAVIGERAGVIFTKLAKHKDSTVELVVFASVHSGRLYEVELTANKGMTSASRPSFYSVVAALDFVSSGSPAPPAEQVEPAEPIGPANAETSSGS